MPTLVRLTRDPDSDVREAALEALPALWPDAPETVTALHAASRGFHTQTRANAREALDRRALGHLRSRDETVRVAGQGHPAQRVDAIEELAMRWPDAPETLEALRSCAVADNEFVRQGAIRILTEAWPRIPGLPAMALRAIQDGNAVVRRYAVTALSDVLHPDDAVAAVAAAITDRHWAVRTTALHRLMTRWPERKETLALLREATGDPDWYVRRMAHDLLHLRVRDHDENHWAITCDPHPYTQHGLRWLLLSGPHPLPLTPHDLLPLWRDDAETHARAMLLTAPMRGDVPELRPVLAEIALGEDHAVHEAALETLAIWWPEDAETLDTLISGTGHPCPRVRGFAHEALYVRPDQRQTARRLARKALDDPAAPIRLRALELLQVDGPLDAPTLLRLTTDPDEDIAKLAIESLALQEPGDPEVREKLREAVHAFPEPVPRYWFEWHQQVASHI
jgi:HEAT repeat protein